VAMIDVSGLLWFSILLPIAIALPVYYLAIRNVKACVAVIVLSLLPMLYFSLYSLATNTVLIDKALTFTISIYGYEYEFPGKILLMPFNALFAFTICLVGILVVIFSIPYMIHRAEELNFSLSIFYLTYPIYIITMAGVVTATNLLMIYLFFELSLISSFFQILYYGYGDRVRIAFMYLVWTHIGTVLMLIGFVMMILYGHVIDAPLYTGYAPTFNNTTLAMVLILIGLLIKMAALGVHMWLPYVHAEAPTPLSALLSPVFVGLGGYVIIAIILPYGFIAKWKNILMAYAIATALYGAFTALVQKDIKRLLAYSTISQMGYMLLAISTANAWGLVGAGLHYIAHGLGKAILFMSAGYLILFLHTRDITKLGGLYAYHAPLAISSIIGFLNLVGILTIGMIAEITIIVAFAKSVPLWNFGYVLGLVAMLVATAVYAFYTIKVIFFGPPKVREMPVRDGKYYLTLVPIALTAFLSILLLVPPFSSIVWENMFTAINTFIRW